MFRQSVCTLPIRTCSSRWIWRAFLSPKPFHFGGSALEPEHQKPAIDIDRLADAIGQSPGSQACHGTPDIFGLAPAADRRPTCLDHLREPIAHGSRHLGPDESRANLEAGD